MYDDGKKMASLMFELIVGGFGDLIEDFQLTRM